MRVRFYGAARGVTGSCHLLEVGSRRVLVDCGLFQGGADAERSNRSFGFDAASIDAVILTHAHIDHAGRLPLLWRQGFRGRVYAHDATVDLAEVMLRDSAYLQEKDASRDGSDALYTMADAADCMRAFRPVEYGQVVRVCDGVVLRMHDAGHILGSCIAEVYAESGGVKRTVVFSGDVGHARIPLLRPPTPLAHADLVVCESTYGDRLHRSRDDTVAELASIFRTAHEGRGNILIPAFAVGRTQEILNFFGEHYVDWELDRWQIFLDSPLAIRATEIYAKHWDLYEKDEGQRVRQTRFRLPNLRFSETLEQSRALNERQAGAIIIAGSGMCTGGRIRHHLRHHVWKPGTHVIIVGYQAAGTPGRALVDGASSLVIHGETVAVRASVHTVGGLSAHADQRELMEWLSHFRERPPVALVHGEARAMDALARELGAAGWGQVMTPAVGEGIDLDALPTLKPV